jgi:energy-coupling factor transporter ATP-binding protein EcfA2
MTSQAESSDPGHSFKFAGQDVIPAGKMPNDYGKWFIHGPQGSGKTTLASSIAEIGPTLYIDITGEKGIRVIRGTPWFPNITFMRPQSVTALDDICWELASGNHPFKCAVIDSVTGIQRLALRYLLGWDETTVREINRSGIPDKPWQASLDIMSDVAVYWYGLADGQREHPMHIVMTAQTKVKDDFEGEPQLQPDVQPAALGIMLATPDYVVYTDLEDNPEALVNEKLPPTRHIVRFGADPHYRIKARVPHNMRGKIPSIVGRKNQPKLLTLSRILDIGGIPKAKKSANSEDNQGEM